MKTYWKQLILGAAFAAGLSLVCSEGQGAVINAMLKPGQQNTVSDIDYERLLDADGNVKASTTIEEGDILEAILRFTDVNGTVITDELPSDYELTAYTRIKVTKVTSTGTFVNGVELFDFEFDNGFDLNGDNVFETSIQLFEEENRTTSSRFDATVSASEGIDRATTEGNGVLISTFGITTGDDFWEAYDAPNDIGVFRLGDPITQGGLFYFGVSLLTNPGDLAIATIANGGGVLTTAGGNHTDPTIHDLVGNGNLKSPELTVNDDWDAATNTTVVFVAVPEPMSMLAWCGVFGAIGAAGAWRRRKSA